MAHKATCKTMLKPASKQENPLFQRVSLAERKVCELPYATISKIK